MTSTQDRKVLARLGTPQSRDARLFGSAALPSELREGAIRRLGFLGLLCACTFTIFGLSHALWDARMIDGPPMANVVASAIAIGCSLLIFALPRLWKIEASLFLKLGAAYQVVVAFAIALTDHHLPWLETEPVRGWSGVGVWIVIFAVVVPSTPARTLVVAAIAALMDPLVLLGTSLMGNTLPSAYMLPLIFGPTAVGVITAVVSSLINLRMGRKLHEAQELGSYQLVEQLGRGGMGEVWRAQHKLLARPAAIKLIRSDALAGGRGEDADSLLRRFEREAQATAMLESEHTIEVYDFGVSTDGAFYYVMELLDGLDLDLLVTRHGPMSPARAVHLLLQVCESLAEAHEAGLIHRDIKPSNIFVCRRAQKYDFVKLLDFGLVKPPPAWTGTETALTADGSIHGTPTFMPPEIITGEQEIDGRADLYAVGCVAYWLMSGRLVFDVDNPMKQLMCHAAKAPPRLSGRAEQEIPVALEELVHACLEKAPGDRPQSAQELAERLSAIDCGVSWGQARAREWWQQQQERAQLDGDTDPDAPTVPPS